MDPNVWVEEIDSAHARGDYDAIIRLTADLENWARGGGFVPARFASEDICVQWARGKCQYAHSMRRYKEVQAQEIGRLFSGS